MSTIVTRSGKGSPLTNTELDANFTNLNSDKLQLSDLSAGAGISLSAGGAIANTAPDQTVALTGAGTTSVSGTYPNFTITGAGTTYTAGSGLSLTGTEFANTAPDQTVALTGAGATSISGTYPNFTITSANTTYSVGDGGLTQINFTSADNTKLDGIETGATADQTAAQILTAIKTVDGSGSGLDADLLDGFTGAYYYPASNPNGYNNYSLPLATNTVRGGIELFSNTDQSVAANSVTTTASRTYGIQLNSANQAVVNVPWVNTTYSVGNGGLTQINFTSALSSKLGNIEASADVTDTANVTAAGALMDSEVTNLAQVKAFDSSDYATAAQGTTADAALPKAGGTMSGAIAMGTSKITGAGDPTAAQDVATKAYVDANAGGGIALTDLSATTASTGTTGLAYNNTSGVFTYTPAVAITNNNQLTNGAGYTTNTGTVTPSSTDTFTNKSGAISQWTNDSGYTTNVGDITAVTAGTGLTGGGTTGAVTLNVIGGAGITANANDIDLDFATSTLIGGIKLSSDTDQSVAANSVTATASRTYSMHLIKLLSTCLGLRVAQARLLK